MTADELRKSVSFESFDDCIDINFAVQFMNPDTNMLNSIMKLFLLYR